jgi:uncharacterized protein YecE (DUF72 family)
MCRILQYHVGCSGWSYTSWQGPFYRQNIANSGWLNYYSHIFDYVEIDSSFYRIPNVFMVNNWNTKTPKNFKLDNRFRYAIEVRHSSWFQDLTYNFFANNDICLVWSQLAGLQTPPVITTDFLYVRFIGDRSIQEKDFGRIQIDRIAEMQKWAENIKNVQGEDMNLAIVAANNHYAGFGPGTVNIFRNMIGLPEAKWEEKEMGLQKQKQENQYPSHESEQRTLSEFMS